MYKIEVVHAIQLTLAPPVTIAAAILIGTIVATPVTIVVTTVTWAVTIDNIYLSCNTTFIGEIGPMALSTSYMGLWPLCTTPAPLGAVIVALGPTAQSIIIEVIVFLLNIIHFYWAVTI